MSTAKLKSQFAEVLSDSEPSELVLEDCIIIDGQSVPLTASNETIKALYDKGKKDE